MSTFPSNSFSSFTLVRITLHYGVRFSRIRLNIVYCYYLFIAQAKMILFFCIYKADWIVNIQNKYKQVMFYLTATVRLEALVKNNIKSKKNFKSCLPAYFFFFVNVYLFLMPVSNNMLACVGKLTF